MGNITLALPNELQKKMAKHMELKWSEIARRAIERKLNELELEDRILRKSKISDKDIDELSSKIKKEVFLEFNKK